MCPKKIYYLCFNYLFNSDGTTKNLAVIIKAMISVPALKEFGVFTKEKFAYDTVLPKMEAEWAKAGTEIQFGPRCWKTIEGEVDIIVLDDLCASGYQVANRQKGADFKHAHLLLDKLAKYHAATAVDYRKVSWKSDILRWFFL